MSDNLLLFNIEDIEQWRREWHNMPEYEHNDLSPRYQIIVSFACAGDVEDFCNLIGQKINPRNGRQSQSVWYPEQDIATYANMRYIEIIK